MRIIPAYAGSTRPWNPRQPRTGDHPRLRGEHAGEKFTRNRSEGSSPLTRGAHQP